MIQLFKILIRTNDYARMYDFAINLQSFDEEIYAECVNTKEPIVYYFCYNCSHIPQFHDLIYEIRPNAKIITDMVACCADLGKFRNVLLSFGTQYKISWPDNVVLFLMDLDLLNMTDSNDLYKNFTMNLGYRSRDISHLIPQIAQYLRRTQPDKIHNIHLKKGCNLGLYDGIKIHINCDSKNILKHVIRKTPIDSQFWVMIVRGDVTFSKMVYPDKRDYIEALCYSPLHDQVYEHIQCSKYYTNNRSLKSARNI